MAGCKPAESPLAERREERVRSGRLAKRQPNAGGYACTTLLLVAPLLALSVLVACAAAELSDAADALIVSPTGAYFTDKQAISLLLL